MIRLLLISSLFLVLFWLTSQQSYSQVDFESTILQTGIISTKNNDYEISNDFETRFIGESILRISGTTISGNPYYVYHKLTDDGIVIKGKILIDGKFIPLVDKSEITTKESDFGTEVKLSSDQKSTIKPLLLVSHDRTVYWRYTYDITARVFDAEQNPRSNIEQNLGFLPDVDISVEIVDRNGIIIKSFEGKTDLNGYYQNSFLIPDNTPMGKYTVNVTADNKGLVETQILYMYVFGPRSDGKTSSP